MILLGGLGILSSVVFGCLLLAIVAELYYLLWWKNQTITSSNRIAQGYSNHKKGCWDIPKPTSVTDINYPNSVNPSIISLSNNPDIEMGFKLSLDEENVRLPNLGGPPRFLFTIKEETMEDLESDDGKSKTTSKSIALSSSPHFKGTPINNCNYDNPLFETLVEAELLRLRLRLRLRSSPPPQFRILRDAEEKLYRKLVEEAKKNGILKEGSLDISQSCNDIDINEGSSIKFNDIHCPSQVLPSPFDPKDA